VGLRSQRNDDYAGSETSEEEEAMNEDRDSLLASPTCLPTTDRSTRNQNKQRTTRRDGEKIMGEGKVTNAALAARLHITNTDV